MYAINLGIKAKCVRKRASMGKEKNEGYSMDECSPRTYAFES